MKLLKSLMLGLILVFAMNTVVFAENLGTELKDEHTIIYDGAFILEEYDENSLFKRAKKVSDKHDINIIIYTEEMNIYNARNRAEEVYLSYFAEHTDGILYYVNMQTRDYYFLTSGDVKKSLSDNYGLVEVENKVVSDLSDEFYYSSFKNFLKMVDKFEKEADFFLPYCFLNPYRTFGDIFIRFIIAVVAGVIIANIRTGSQKAKLKTVKPEPLAKNYVPKDGFNLSLNKNTFLFKNVTKTAIPKSTSSGGGGSRSGGGGGSSFGGRGGKF